jgi:hypothetical protein
MAVLSRARTSVVLDPDATQITVVLVVRRFEDRVSVTARATRPPIEPVIARVPIDVYRTPGAQGDLFRALQTLPGVVATDEAAGLFVRGGDVSEVLVSIDDAVIAHPYRYETPTGGFRGAVDPLLISGLAFSTGGFSARHGNALSAVVELRGLDRPELPEMTGTLGLAGASASVATPIHDRVGIRAAANRTFTGLLFAVNDSSRRFDPAPEGWDGSASLDWDLNEAGRVRTFVLLQRDSVGVETEQDAGWLQSSSRHGFTSARWNGSLGQWAAAAMLGIDSYSRRTAVGVLNLNVEDLTQSWRIEASRRSSRVDWRVGGSGAVADTTTSGRVPAAGRDLAGISGDSAFDVDTNDWYGGAYMDATTAFAIASSRWCATTSRSSAFDSVIACGSQLMRIPPPPTRSCRRCCCNHSSRTLSDTGSNPTPMPVRCLSAFRLSRGVFRSASPTARRMETVAAARVAGSS